MASGVRVQNYLEKHKIGGLFEELMGRVISDQPDEPVMYLMRLLERKANKMGLSVKKSVGEPDKPWQANMKKTKRPATANSLGSRPEFDSKPVRNATTFDDLWNESKTSKAPARSKSPPKKPQPQTGGVTWAKDEDEDFLYKSTGYRGPRRSDTADPLAGEFRLAKEDEEETTKTAATQLSHGRVKGQKVDAMKHRKQLEQLILEEKQRHQQQLQQQDSGIEEEHEVGAVELAENLDDLKSEGVNIRGAKWKKSGMTVQNAGRALKLMRQRLEQKRADPASNVRVSICATCAKVMQGGEPSAVAKDTFGQLPDFEDNRSNVSKPQSAANVSPGPSDDEFESVSQVTGPRRPVWQEDSDNEARTPRKGAHMFASAGVPSKGRPMFSTADKNKMSSTLPAAKSEDFVRTASGQAGQADLQMTWSPGQVAESEGKKAATIGSIREEESTASARDTARDTVAPDNTTFIVGEEKDDDPVVGTASAFGSSSHGWQVPATDYDTDASDMYPANGRKYYSGQY